MSDSKKFDVFISYRNSYFETRPDGTKRKIDVGFGVAKEVAFLLNYKKYRVYFDNFTLSGGDDYERHIFTSIPECSDVILVLVPQALDRCTGDNDIFGREIVAALEGGKNIIPVFVNGFSLPESIDKLPEMLRAPAKKYQEKTGRSFVRLQGAKVQASETISAENSRIIKNTIFAEVIPYLKSVPGIQRQTVPDDIPKSKESPFGAGKKKILMKAVVAAAVIALGAAAYLKLEFSSAEKTAALPPPSVEIISAGTAEEVSASVPAVADEALAGTKDAEPQNVASEEEVPEPPAPTAVPAEPAPAESEPEQAAAAESEPSPAPSVPEPEKTDADVPAAAGDEAPQSVPAPAPISVEELVAAVKAENAERISEILASGTDVNALAENGATALCSAALRPNVEVLSLLLDAGADPNIAMTTTGMTPLHIAVARGNTANVKLLLAADADVAAKTKEGLFPIDFAKSDEVKRLLENFAKK